MNLSVIIPYRPRTEWDSFPALKQVIESIREQYFPADIIVSLQGATEARLGSIITVRDKYSGPFNRSRALNRGIAKAKSGGILCLDADCILIKKNVTQDVVAQINDGKHVVYRVVSNHTINRHGSGEQGFSKEAWRDGLKWDEHFIGYGREDIDLLTRAEKKYRIAELEGGILHINHPRPMEDKETRRAYHRNNAYFHEKHAL